MKRQDYEDTAMRIWVDAEEEKICFRLSWEEEAGSNEGLVKLDYSQVKVPCEVCGESITVNKAIIEDEQGFYTINEHGKQIGRDEENYHADFTVPFYCSEKHAIAGEL